MLEAQLQFEGNSLDSVLTAFLALPALLRPTHFSHGEEVDNHDDLITDRLRFSKFVQLAKSGFFLLSHGITYSVRIITGKSIIIDCFLDVDNSVVPDLLRGMALSRPLFGFACSPQERQWRNLIKTKIGQNTIEDWVGRDPKKYVPGLYWLTLVSQPLIDMHKIPLDLITAKAIEMIDCGEGRYLLIFYRHPEDWKDRRSEIDRLCADTEGFFSALQLKLLLANVRTAGELRTMLRDWR